MNLRLRVALAGGAAMITASAVAGAIEYPAIGAGMRAQLDASLVDAVRQSPDSLKDVRDKVLSGSPAAAGPTAGGSAAGSGGRVTKENRNGVEDTEKSAPPAGVPVQGYVLRVGTGLLQLVVAPVVGPSDRFTDVTPHDVDVAAGRSAAYFQDAVYGGKLYRVYTAAMPGYPDSVIRAARLESDPAPTLHALLWLLVLLTPAAGLLAAAVARLLAGRVLRPVGTLTAAVEHITSTGDLTGTVEVRGRDEVGRLGRAFTAMTVALDGTVGAQRRLVADASHELRTPLTSLVTNLELIAESPADPHTPVLADKALAQARELSGLVDDLVELARCGQAPGYTEDVRLDLLAAAVAERRNTSGAAVAVEVVAEEPVMVHGDPDALERAVGNLVDNAVKFVAAAELVAAVGSPDPPPVLVTVRHVESRAVVDVRDHGPGIPAADLPYIFDRFHRSPAARSLPGSGLGLAIVKQVAETHGGSVETVPVPDGACFRLVLPAVAVR
ncbi:hypothetical protein GCM10009839_65910 [Catenulispora yoronensis]|uniref:histidine kinase n=1 Tax=Catenulispora yoronensis TaxID=450799 RepID=A0ABN2V4F5_9ACTN